MNVASITRRCAGLAGRLEDLAQAAARGPVVILAHP